jgi:hypothetical protein
MHSSNLGMKLTMINIYGPYLDQALLWESVLNKSFFNSDAQIVGGGDLNFLMGSAEVWGPKARPDPLSNFFNILERKRAIDISPIKAQPHLEE